MGFAEQLAARAAETSSHNTQSHRRLTPPRPGKIINRGGVIKTPVNNNHGSSKSIVSSSPSSSSPSLFADQLKLVKARRDSPSPSRKTVGASSTSNNGTASSSCRSLDDSFANQISDRSVNDETGRSRSAAPVPPLPSPTVSHAESTDATLLSGGTRSRELNDSTASNNTAKDQRSPSNSHRSILIPSCDYRNNSHDDSEDDEYASVGFSLNASIDVSTVDGDDNGVARGVERRGEPSKEEVAMHDTKVQLSSTIATTISPVRVGESYNGQTWASTTKSKLQTEEERNSPTAKDRIARLQQHPKSPIFPQQQQNTFHVQPQLNKTQTPEAIDDGTGNSSPSSNPIFGAWAQIESLKQRVREAEERADSQECQHCVELANSSCEKICREDCGSVEDTPSAAVHDCADDGAGVSLSEASSPDVDAAEASPVGEAEIEQWKKRALEAEERLAREVERLELAASTATVDASTSNTPQSIMPAIAPPPSPPDNGLIQLKNAEINVLRSQIHRLERCIQEKHDLNQDFRSSSSSYHHFLQDRPPFVVASKEEIVCNMAHSNSTRTTSSSTENYNNGVNDYEFQMLRNEIRNLQYQLQRSNTRASSLATTALATLDNASGGGSVRATNTAASMGESTLSLSLDGNENHYTNEEEEGGEVEMMEDGVSRRSSWGLCCIRYGGGGRPRRGGYGRV